MKLQKNFYEALILLKLGDFNNAEILYEEVINSNPNDDELLVEIFKIYDKRYQFDKAIKYLSRAIKINPKPIYYKILGNTYGKNKNFEEAKRCYLYFLKTNPDNVDALFKLGMAYSYNMQNDEAKVYFEKVLKIRHNDPIMLYNLALVHKKLLEIDKTIECLVKAIEYRPNYYEAMFVLSELMLQTSNFSLGWKLYEARLHARGIADVRSSKPKWDGFPLKNKTIYLQREQGIGDCIMFSRFVPVFSAFGAKVLFKPHPQLEQLFIDSKFPAKIINNLTPVESLEFDTHLTLMSSGYALNLNESNIPYKTGYIKADAEKVKKYKEKYFNNNRLKIGIVWQCKNVYFDDFQRSIPNINCLFTLFKIPNVAIYSLQKGPATEQLKNLPEGIKITNLGSTFDDFADTAAAVENLDLVVTVDTSLLHLSGAMGKPTLALIEHFADWKWLIDRDNSIWYEKIKLFRHDKSQNWDYPVNEVVEYIRAKYSHYGKHIDN